MKRVLKVLLAFMIGVSSIAGNSVTAKADGEKTVVALDPGHDNRHGGATAGGLNEQDLTLKIAYYCKAELEKYDDIEVYMTRTGDACPYPYTTSSARCIEQRMLGAQFAGASLYVSFHLNAEDGGTSASGVEVIYPNSNWKPEVGSQGKKLAQYIQEQITGLGLYDRGIYYRNSTIGERYPDGSASDYYTVQISGKESGIPSVIVENAFITNTADRNNFLSTEAGLKQLGVANAKAILKALGYGWRYIDGQWYYYTENGFQTGWQYIEGYWYYMNENGAIQTGWQLVDGEWYYMSSSGAMQTGWLLDKGEWYYLTASGAMQRGWKTINGTKYFFNTNGEMVDGAKAFIIDVSHWQGTVDWDKVARTEVDGVIVRCGHGDDITEADGKWQDKNFEKNIAALKRLGIPYGVYHYNTATTVEQAYVQAQNAVEMMKSANVIPTLPVFVDIEQDAGACDLVAIAKVYMEVFAANGYQPGIYANANYWKNYLNDSSLDGYQKWIANYGVNDGYASTVYEPTKDLQDYMMWQYTSQGIIDGITENTVDCNVLFDWYEGQNGWVYRDGNWFYYVNGNVARGWRSVDNIWYYFANSGIMLTGWQLINGSWYYMDASGAMTTGWQPVDGVWYYMNTSGAMTTGWQKVNGTWYYMDASGAMQTGWQFVNGAWYYMNANGGMTTGWQYVSGNWYYMNANGAMTTGWQLVNGVWYYMNASGAWVG